MAHSVNVNAEQLLCLCMRVVAVAVQLPTPPCQHHHQADPQRPRDGRYVTPHPSRPPPLSGVCSPELHMRGQLLRKRSKCFGAGCDVLLVIHDRDGLDEVAGLQDPAIALQVKHKHLQAAAVSFAMSTGGAGVPVLLWQRVRWTSYNPWNGPSPVSPRHPVCRHTRCPVGRTHTPLVHSKPARTQTHPAQQRRLPSPPGRLQADRRPGPSAPAPRGAPPTCNTQVVTCPVLVHADSYRCCRRGTLAAQSGAQSRAQCHPKRQHARRLAAKGCTVLVPAPEGRCAAACWLSHGSPA
jgi:hypothetical protein